MRSLVLIMCCGCAAAQVPATEPSPSIAGLLAAGDTRAACRVVSQAERGLLGEALLEETGGVFRMHAFTRAELQQALPYLPPALDHENALVVVTTMRVDRVPYDRIDIESRIQHGPTTHASSSCCDDQEWFDLLEIEPAPAPSRPRPAPPPPDYCRQGISLRGILLDIVAGLTTGLVNPREPGRPSELFRPSPECHPPSTTPAEADSDGSSSAAENAARAALQQLVRDPHGTAGDPPEPHPCRVTSDGLSCVNARIQTLDSSASSAVLVISLRHEDRTQSPPCAIHNLATLRLDPDLPPAEAINQHFGEEAVPLSSLDWR